MKIDRKTVIWHPDDAKALDGKGVIAFDTWCGPQIIGQYIGKSGDYDYPFKVKIPFIPAGISAFIAPLPEPKYRPFANAEEFAPHREKWLRTKNGGELWRVYSYNNAGIITPSSSFIDYEKMFGTYDFEDGSPCGVEDV